MSLGFAFIWGVVLLPLPWLARHLPPATFQSPALRVPFFARHVAAEAQPARRVNRRVLVIWLLLIGALIRPELMIGDTVYALYRPLLVGALILTALEGLRLTRQPKAPRSLPAHYYREPRP